MSSRVKLLLWIYAIAGLIFLATWTQSQPPCHYQSCEAKIPGGNQTKETGCNVLQEVRDCITMLREISECAKLKDEIDELETIVRDLQNKKECHGKGTATCLMASLGVCLALSAVTYFLTSLN